MSEAQVWLERRRYRAVALVDGVPVGLVTATTLDRIEMMDGSAVVGPAVELDLAIHPDHRGRGYGETAVRLAAEHIEALDVGAAVALIATDNVGSLATFARAGWTNLGEMMWSDDVETVLCQVYVHGELSTLQ